MTALAQAVGGAAQLADAICPNERTLDLWGSKVRSFRQWAAANCAAPPTASASAGCHSLTDQRRIIRVLFRSIGSIPITADRNFEDPRISAAHASAWTESMGASASKQITVTASSRWARRWILNGKTGHSAREESTKTRGIEFLMWTDHINGSHLRSDT